MHLKQFLNFLISKCLLKPRFTIFIFLLLSVISIIISYEKLEIITSTDKLISENVEFKKKQKKLRESFPIISENIVIVIKSESTESLNVSTRAILRELKKIESELVFFYSPNLNFFFKNNFFYLIDEKKQNKILQDLFISQPFISEINSNPKLLGFNNLIELFLNEDSSSEKTKVFERIFNSFDKSILNQKPVNWKDALDSSTKENYIIFKIKRKYLEEKSFSNYYDVLQNFKKIGSEDVSLNFTGSSVLDYEEVKSVTEGAAKAGILSLIFVFVILYLAFRSLILVLLLLFTIIVGLSITLGFITIFVGSLNIISVAFAVLFIGISVDFGIQISSRYLENLKTNSPQDISSSINSVISSLVIVTITSLIGFLSFIPTQYIGLSQLGIVSGIGLVVGLFTNLFFLSSCLSLIKLKKIGYLNSLNLIKIFNFLLVNKNHFILLFSITMLFGLLSLKDINFDSDPLKLKDQKSQSVILAKNLMENNPASDNFISIYKNNFDESDLVFLKKEDLIKTFFSLQNVVLDSSVKDELSYLQYLYSNKSDTFFSSYSEVERLKKNLKKISIKYPQLLEVSNSLLLQLEKINLNKKENLKNIQNLWFKDFEVLLKEIDLITNLKRFDYNKIPFFYKERYFSNNNIQRIEVYPKKNISNKDNLKEFVKKIESRFPNSIGMPIIQLEAGKIVIHSFIFAFFVSFIFLFIFSFIIFKNFFYSIFCILPLIFSSIFISLIMKIFNLNLNFANMIALPLLFSLGTSYSIYVIKRALDLRSIEKMLKSSTPFAVLFSGLTTIASFATFTFSNHAGTASMGILLFISLSSALLFCTLILPFFMKIFKLTF